MDLAEFEDVHPNWDIIASLERDELEGLIGLTSTLLAIDDTLEANERSKIIHTLFDGCSESLDAERIQQLEWDAEERLATETPADLRDELTESAQRLDGEAKRIAALRLLAMLAFTSEATPEEVEFLQAAAQAMDLDDKLAEDVARAAWETRQGPVETRVRDRSENPRTGSGANFLWGQRY